MSISLMTEAWKCDNANDQGERALREERDKVRFLTELLHGKAAA